MNEETVTKLGSLIRSADSLSSLLSEMIPMKSKGYLCASSSLFQTWKSLICEATPFHGPNFPCGTLQTPLENTTIQELHLHVSQVSSYLKGIQDSLKI